MSRERARICAPLAAYAALGVAGSAAVVWFNVPALLVVAQLVVWLAGLVTLAYATDAALRMVEAADGLELLALHEAVVTAQARELIADAPGRHRLTDTRPLPRLLVS